VRPAARPLAAPSLNRSRAILGRPASDRAAMKPKDGAAGLRLGTRTWIAQHTLKEAHSIASDLANAGEDVHELLDAIKDLERIVKSRPSGPKLKNENQSRA